MQASDCFNAILTLIFFSSGKFKSLVFVVVVVFSCFRIPLAKSVNCLVALTAYIISLCEIFYKFSAN